MMKRIAACAVLCATAAQAQNRAMPPEGERELARAIYKEMIEVKSGFTTGATTPVAEAVAQATQGSGLPRRGHLRRRREPATRRTSSSATTAPDAVVPFSCSRTPTSSKRSAKTGRMDPFTLNEKDGYFYGRGIGDDKAQAAIWIANLIRYKREGFKPDRDIIVALTADEEGGGPYNGVKWLLKNNRDLIDAELCLNEGGWGETVRRHAALERHPGQREVRRQLPVRGAQQGRSQLAAGRRQRDLPPRRRARSPVEVRLPAQDQRRDAGVLPRDVEDREGPDQRRSRQGGRRATRAAMARVAAASTPWNATLRTTCVATQLEGGHAKNALPQLAAANVNCRVLPEDPRRAT